MDPRCKATTTDGRPCAAHVRPGDEFCRWHDPARAEDRKAWQRRGGKGKANAARLRKLWEGEALTPDQVAGLLSAAMVGVMTGAMEPAAVSALAAGARALIATREASDMDNRLARLEAALADRRLA